MTLYRLKIQLLGRIVTPLIGDTIFGHFIWGIARRQGQDAATDFLSKLEDKPFVISSAFQEGYLPKPLLAPAWSDNVEKYSKLKKLKKAKYVPANLFQEGKPLSEARLLEAISQSSENREIFQLEQDRLHATVDRYAQGTLEEVGLYSVTEKWLAWKHEEETYPHPVFDIYILCCMEKSQLLEMSNWAFEHGFGADTSTGAGHVKVIALEEALFPQQGNRAMALGPFVLQDSNAVRDMRANIFIRRGKLAFDFGNFMNPFKKPIVFFDQGSTFSYTAGMLPWIGSMVRNVHSDNRIVQQGWAPIIPYFEEEP